MKKLTFLLIMITGLVIISCNEKKSERFLLLTTPVWTADSLLADGVDASAAGQLLSKFIGDAKFKEDGTGYFGKYTGEWLLSSDENNITIIADSLQLPIVAKIAELTTISLKITTSVPNPLNFLDQIAIRMTFKAK